MPKRKLKVGWLLLGDINTGSSRIHGINIHNYLLKNGIESVILQTSPRMTNILTLSREEQENVLHGGFDALIFQKVRDEKAQVFAREARNRGIRTIFLLSDRIDTDMVSAVDDLVVTSGYLRDYYHDQYGVNAAVIEDAVEVAPSNRKHHDEKRPLTLVWVGYSDNWGSVEIVREALDSLSAPDFILKTISNHPDADVPWALDTVTDEILSGDIGVIPAHLTEWGMGKSANRLTMYMALGMPVVASPVPSYLDIVEDGVNGFIARTTDEWIKALTALKDVEARIAICRQARTDILNRFGIETIGNRWLKFIHLPPSGRKGRGCPQ